MKRKKVASKPKKEKKVEKEVKEAPKYANGIIEVKGGFVVYHNEAMETFTGGDELSCFNEACKRYKLLMIS